MARGPLLRARAASRLVSGSPRTRRLATPAAGPGAVVAALAIALAVALAEAARATTVELLSDVDLIDRAALIVEGTVIAKTSTTTTTPAGGTRVFTTIELAVSEVYKGGAATTTAPFVFHEWGGAAAGVTWWIPGRGDLEPGDEVILFFAAPVPTGAPGFTLGLAQGKLAIERPGAGGGGRPRVRRSFRGLDLIDTAGLPVPHAPGDEVRDLESWRELIRGRVQGRR